MYILETRKNIDEIFKKLTKKNPKQMDLITKKLQEILTHPHRFKSLRFPLAGKRRVHFGSYVLIFSIDEPRKTVVLEDYDHHDRIYILNEQENFLALARR